MSDQPAEPGESQSAARPRGAATGPWIAWKLVPQAPEGWVLNSEVVLHEDHHAWLVKRGYIAVPVSLASKAPEMRDEITSLRAEMQSQDARIKILTTMLEEIQYDEACWMCPVCGRRSDEEPINGPGHASDCRLAKLLANTEESA